MTHYSRSELDALKRSVDLADYARHLGIELRAVGSRYRGNCPLPGHTDSTPSFYVNSSEQFYHCFGCSCSGDIYELNKLLYGDDFIKSVERVKSYASGNATAPSYRNTTVGASRRLGCNDRRLLEHVVSHYGKLFKANSEPQAYLHSRKISDEAFDKFQIGFANGYLNRRFPKSLAKLKELGLVSQKGTDCYYRQITVPVRESSGAMTQLYGRSIDSKRHRYLAYPHRTLFHAEGLSVHKRAILCESILDAMTLYSHGFSNVSAVYGANGLRPRFASQIAEVGVQSVVFAYDADKAGNEGVLKGAKLLKSWGVDSYRMPLPSGMDVNDVAKLSSQPDNELRKLYKHAILS